MSSTSWFASGTPTGSGGSDMAVVPETLLAMRVARPTRVKALLFVHRHKIDEADFQLMAEALGLDDLLVEKTPA